MTRSTNGRYAALPMPQMIGVVAMKDVPDPPMKVRRDKYSALWKQIVAMAPGKAYMLKVTNERQANYIRGKFKKKAKALGRFFSTSHTPDGLTWYLWLEPKEEK